MSVNISYYNKNAVELAKQYNSLSFESVHSSWKQYWPEKGANVLDVGAGSGRDAQWFSQQDCSVVAVEPASALRRLAISNSSAQILWVEDSLPALASVNELSRQYDLILLSAVWMHLTTKQRTESMKVLSLLLSEKGKLVITLRHGSFVDGRETYGVSVTEIEEIGRYLGLSVCHVVDGEDSLMRAEIMWQTVILESSKVINVGR
ncbi:class I SAM-dependent methyltransferase [Vibrio sp. YIC-376]|uniref:class I SAM-dependent methyltransferase n=1 Tax=Vibrio sp. YIC-376 TaxID=3136162 RepID=UPI00402AF472